MSEFPEVSLKEYVEVILSARQQYYESRLADIHSRMLAMNDFREQLTDQNTDFTNRIALYMPRDEYGARHESLIQDIRRIEALFVHYVRIESLKSVNDKVDRLVEWRANLAGRLWAGAGVFAAGNVLLILLRAHFSAG